MTGTVQILGIRIHKVTMEEAIARCLSFIESRKPHMVVTPNAEFLYRAQHHAEWASVLSDADLAIADGAGVVLASRWLGDPVPEKVAGVELAERLMAELAGRGGSVFLFGTRPEVVAEAAFRLPQRYPGLQIAGVRHGFFRPEEEPVIRAEIKAAKPDLLLVALGSPRQELWIHQHLAELEVPVAIGIGGGIDVWAGAVPRAPRWMIRANLEWLYRIVRLGRFSRSLPPIIKFLLLVLRERRRS